MRKHHVLQFIDSFHRGGTELQTVQLVRLLHESGRFNVRLACTRDEGPLRDEVKAIGIPPVEVFPLGSFRDRNMVVQLGRLRGYIREHSISLIHTHDFYTNVFGMLGGFVSRVPVRIASRRETNGVRSKGQRFVENRIFRMATRVVANSEAVRQQIIDEGLSPDRVLTIHNALDARRYGPPVSRQAQAELRTALGLPADADRQIVVLLANIGLRVKDHPTFLRAARVVHAAHPRALFALAGEGGLIPEMQALARELGIEDSVIFLGRCTRVSELLSVSSVGVLSSLAEGFSNAIIEYMAASLPVVATNVGGAAEAIVEGATGHLVDPGDWDTMAARISALLADPERARSMGAAGRARALSEFSLATRLERTEALYDALLAGVRHD